MSRADRSPSSNNNFAQVSLSSGNVFGDNTAAQLTQQTPTFTAATSGYTATALIGIAVVMPVQAAFARATSRR